MITLILLQCAFCATACVVCADFSPTAAWRRTVGGMQELLVHNRESFDGDIRKIVGLKIDVELLSP